MTDDGGNVYEVRGARVRVYADAEAVARAAAARFAELAGECVRAEGRFSVALSGGSTPRRIYELLAGAEFAPRVEWTKVHAFFGDERCVPPDDAESNYRAARESLLSRVPVPAENVHRMIGEGDAAANARLYEDELRAFFGEGRRQAGESGAFALTSGASGESGEGRFGAGEFADDEWPRFDLVMLGMGGDGHTASLFPSTPALGERRAWVAANWVEKLGAYRLTLTAPAVNAAAHVMFVVTGAGKSARLREVVEGARDPTRLPAQLVRPARGTLEWYVDQAAASQLTAGGSQRTTDN